MLKVVLGVIAGFVAWSIIWVGSDAVLSTAWAEYGAHQNRAILALANNESFAADNTIMAVRLVISIVATLMSGFLAAFIAGENRRAPLALGVILLLVGIAVQLGAWNVMPVWFHVIFLLLLLPMSILGGKLKKTASA
jgi:hypothetical protein